MRRLILVLANLIILILVILIAVVITHTVTLNSDAALIPTQVAQAVSATEAGHTSLAPTLLTPSDQSSFANAAAVTLHWMWYRPLADDEYFDLSVWPDGKAESGITWTQDTSFDLQDWLLYQQPGVFDWTVNVIRKAADGSGTPVSDPAPTQHFTMSKIDMDVMDVPQGFTVKYYAKLPFTQPTVIAFGPDGALYALSVEGDVARISNDDGDDFAETVKVIYTDTKNLLDHAVGMTFDKNKVMYISDGGRISTLTDSDGDGILDRLTPIVTGLPNQQWTFHSNNGIAFGPDGKLYVGVGSTSDHGPLKVKYEASILRLNPDGSDLETFASGFRNSYDLTFSPQGDLFTADNSPDEIDQTLSYFPPEEIDHVQQGKNYGFPNVFGFPPPGSDTAPPVVELPTSSASSGIAYYAADQFPDQWHGLYLAEFGTGADHSVAAGVHTGRMVVFVSLKPDGHGSFTGSWQPFAVFKNGLASNYTPIDVTVGSDGALYIAEWNSSTIYRVTYTGTTTSAPEATESAVDQGQALFANGVPGAPACASCHSTVANGSGVGPSLAGLAQRAGSRIAGMSADDYVRQSILMPNAFVVPGYSAGVMFQSYAQKLTPQQIDNLIAYVLSL